MQPLPPLKAELAPGPWPNPGTWAELSDKLTGWRAQALAAAERAPLESLAAVVGAGTLVYYLSERGRNERVHTIWDALEFVSTCASVGYSNIFPNTPLGKLVASFTFLVGPAMTARALEQPGAPARGQRPTGDEGSVPMELLAKLDEILVELRRRQG